MGRHQESLDRAMLFEQAPVPGSDALLRSAEGPPCSSCFSFSS